MRLQHLILATAAFIAPAALAQTDSPAAVQETKSLNQDQASQAAQSDSRYQQQQQLYQQQQQQYQAQKRHYESQASRYLAARDRYAAERARYRRGDWPERYEKLTFVDTDALMDAPVETYTGARVGHVEELARRDGHIDAVRVAMDGGTRHAWVDRGDLKFDTEDRLLVTDLARHDLYTMSNEQY